MRDAWVDDHSRSQHVSAPRQRILEVDKPRPFARCKQYVPFIPAKEASLTCVMIIICTLPPEANMHSQLHPYALTRLPMLLFPMS